MASKKVKLDFTGVESFQRPSEGEHVCRIVSAELKQSQGGNDMIVVAFEVTKGQDKGARVFENYPLAENALWKLKGMLQAIGMKCDGKVQLDLDKLIGKICIVSVIDDEYNGQVRSRVQECRKLAAVAEDEDDEDIDDDEDDDEEEEEPAPKKKAPAKKESKPAPKKKAPMNPPEEDDEDEDDEDWDDEDEEEEEEKPAKKAAKKSAAPAKKPVKKAPAKKKPEPEDDDDEDDDDDWDEE